MRRLAILALMTIALSAPAFAQGFDPVADIEHWNRVNRSTAAADIQTYIDTFPNGTFIEQARARLQAIQSGQPLPVTAVPAATPPTALPVPSRPAAAPQPVAPPQSATVQPVPRPPAPPAVQPGSATTQQPFQLTADMIRDVQLKLYNLNYDTSPMDGRMNAATRTALTQWRARVNSTGTGDPNQQEVATLRNAVTPKTWGAIGYNPNGGASTHWNVDDRQKAEALAMEGCRKLNGGNCNTVTAPNTICGAMSHASGVVGNTRYNSAFAIVRQTLGQATDFALTECRAKAKVPNNCAIRVTMCADGSHKK